MSNSDKKRSTEESKQAQAFVDALRECLGLAPLYNQHKRSGTKIYGETYADPIRTRP
jgi:hypothetical protein